MSSALPRLAVAFALLSWGAGVAAASAPLAKSPLAIDVRWPVLAGGELSVEVRRSGALAARDIVVFLAVDGIAVGRFPLDRPVQRITVRPSPLTAGRHEVLVKSGSDRAAVTVRVWPRWSPWLVLSIVLAALALAIRAWRHRARHAAADRRAAPGA